MSRQTVVPEVARVRVSADFAVAEWDAAAERIFGWRVDQALGESFPALVGMDPVERINGHRLLDHHHVLVGTHVFTGMHETAHLALRAVRLPDGTTAGEFFPLRAPSSATQGSVATFIDRADGWQVPDAMETPRERRRRTIGENITRFREIKQISRYALARKLGVDRSQLIKWETGVWEPNAQHIAELAETLGVPDWTFYIPQERVA
jgi:DNA-binding XRE family transcriptional regulator